jgi:ABC-type uncharacterized transport system permease subunit
MYIFSLLFANPSGTYATANTVVHAKLSLVLVQISYMITGEVPADQGVGIYQATTSQVRCWSKG